MCGNPKIVQAMGDGDDFEVSTRERYANAVPAARQSTAFDVKGLHTRTFIGQFQQTVKADSYDGESNHVFPANNANYYDLHGQGELNDVEQSKCSCTINRTWGDLTRIADCR
jgi:hypothetical protein